MVISLFRKLIRGMTNINESKKIHADEEMKDIFSELRQLSADLYNFAFTIWNKTSSPGVYLANLSAVLTKDNQELLDEMIFKTDTFSRKINEVFQLLDYYASVEETFSKQQINNEIRKTLLDP